MGIRSIVSLPVRRQVGRGTPSTRSGRGQPRTIPVGTYSNRWELVFTGELNHAPVVTFAARKTEQTNQEPLP